MIGRVVFYGCLVVAFFVVVGEGVIELVAAKRPRR